ETLQIALPTEIWIVAAINTDSVFECNRLRKITAGHQQNPAIMFCRDHERLSQRRHRRVGLQTRAIVEGARRAHKHNTLIADLITHRKLAGTNTVAGYFWSGLCDVVLLRLLN